MNASRLPFILGLTWIAGCGSSAGAGGADGSALPPRQSPAPLAIIEFLRVRPESLCIVEPSDPHVLDRGTLDTAVVAAVSSTAGSSQGYIAAPLVQDNAGASDDGGASAAGPIALSSFEVELESAPAPAVPLPSLSRTHFVTAARPGTLMPSDQLVSPTEVIPLDLVNQLNALNWSGTVIVHLRPVGNAQKDGTISGSWSDFPIDVCQNCLATPGTSTPCPSGGFRMTQIAVGGCFAGQDDPITCCLDSTTHRPECGTQVPLAQ
jgi:hypothetical protein